MGTANGIYLYNKNGADSYSESGDEYASGQATNDADIFVYNVDVSAGETVTLTGNFGDGDSATGGANFAQGGPDPAFGTLVINLNGTFTYTFDRDDVDANGGNQTIEFTVIGNYGGGSATDTDTVQVVITCFVSDTIIATPGGAVAVQNLAIGDTVRTADGRDVPVKWVGRQTVSTRFGPAERLMPVRFAAGSLGGGLPHTDLTVTADHGMLVDGVICHAGALVNGTTITRVPLAEMGETYTVYHIETEEHEIILANGAPAETFIDNVSRRVFDNYAEFEALCGDVPEMEELPYPRAMSARQVPSKVKSRLSLSKAA